MRVSYSSVDTFKQCKYKYYLNKILKLQTKFNEKPDNALALGTALHTGIEKHSVKKAIDNYFKNYKEINKDVYLESIQLEVIVNKAINLLPTGIYETPIIDSDFIGFIDMLVSTENENEYDLYDFKYTKNQEKYLKSNQLHVYKYWFEKLNPNKKIRNLYFVFANKIKIDDNIRKREDCVDYLYRKCEEQNIDIIKIEYDPYKIIDFLLGVKQCSECVEFTKNISKLCNYCDYEDYCKSNGEDDSNIIYPKQNV